MVVLMNGSEGFVEQKMKNNHYLIIECAIKA